MLPRQNYRRTLVEIQQIQAGREQWLTRGRKEDPDLDLEPDQDIEPELDTDTAIKPDPDHAEYMRAGMAGVIVLSLLCLYVYGRSEGWWG